MICVDDPAVLMELMQVLDSSFLLCWTVLNVLDDLYNGVYFYLKWNRMRVEQQTCNYVRVANVC